MNRHVYIVSYDLRHTLVRNYSGFYGALQSFPSWMHHIDNTWLIVSDVSSKEIYNRLAPHIFTDCHILIMRVTSDYFGLLPDEAWNWINSNRVIL